MPDSRTWMGCLWILSKIILLGQNLVETALSLDRSIKPNDLLYPKRLTLYDEIYIGHTLCIALVNPSDGLVWNIDTGPLLRTFDHTGCGLKILATNPEYLFWRREGIKIYANFVWIVLKYL
jgi:hypothetical protein